MVTLPEFKCGRAEVCKYEIRTFDGTLHSEWSVRLPDSHIIRCGTNEAGARFVCDAINVQMKWANTYPPPVSLSLTIPTIGS